MCRRWSSLRSVYTPKDAIFRLYFHFKHLCIVKIQRKIQTRTSILIYFQLTVLRPSGRCSVFTWGLVGEAPLRWVWLYLVWQTVIFDLAIGYIWLYLADGDIWWLNKQLPHLRWGRWGEVGEVRCGAERSRIACVFISIFLPAFLFYFLPAFLCLFFACILILIFFACTLIRFQIETL